MLDAPGFIEAAHGSTEHDPNAVGQQATLPFDGQRLATPHIPEAADFLRVSIFDFAAARLARVLGRIGNDLAPCFERFPVGAGERMSFIPADPPVREASENASLSLEIKVKL